MAGEPGAGSGAGPQGPAGQGQPDPNRPPVADPNKPAAPAPRTIPEEVLPEQLRGRSPEEVRFVLNNLVSGVKASNERTKQLEKELHDLKASGTKPKEPEKPKKPPEERILEEPEAVIRETVERLYGPTVQSISAGVEEAAFRAARSDYDDFKDVEEDVKAILKEAGVPGSRENIDRAYALAVGNRTIEQRRQAAQKANNPLESKGDKLDKPADLPALEGLEKEVFEASGMTREDWDRHKRGDVEVRVPTGKRKEKANA